VQLHIGDPPTATGYLEATTSSGKPSLIPDPTTRASLTSLAAEIEDFDRLNVELDRMGAEAAAVMGEHPSVRQVPAAVEIEPEGLQALRRDARLQGLASARIIFLSGYWFSLDTTVRSRVEQTIRDIDENLSVLR